MTLLQLCNDKLKVDFAGNLRASFCFLAISVVRGHVSEGALQQYKTAYPWRLSG
jgi:hypothetical protein